MTGLRLFYLFGRHWPTHVWNLCAAGIFLILLVLIATPAWLSVPLAAICGAAIYNSVLIVSLRFDARHLNIDLDDLPAARAAQETKP